MASAMTGKASCGADVRSSNGRAQACRESTRRTRFRNNFKHWTFAVDPTAFLLLSKGWFSWSAKRAYRKRWCGAHARDRPAELPACCLHETLRSLKPTPENVMTVPAQPLSKALGSIRVDRSRSNVGTTEALGRQPKVVSQIKPHEHAALVGGPPSFLIDATLGHTRRWARYRGDRSGIRLNPATPPIAGAREQYPCYGLSRAVRFRCAS